MTPCIKRCVDNQRAAHLESKSGNGNGNLWYTTVSGGGSMSKSLYPNEVELGCTVCLSPTATYTRWGATSCDGGRSATLYKGIAAGSYHGHKGSGYNTLCLHEKPESTVGNVGSSAKAYIYGTEYMGPGGKNIHGDAACAVCEVSSPGHVHVQVGRSKSCSSSPSSNASSNDDVGGEDGAGDGTVTTLYTGSVMASYHTSNHMKAEFLCVDPERAVHSASAAAAESSQYWYTASADSGAIDEERYPRKQQVGCSVCHTEQPSFTRWGSNSCPAGTTELYRGTMAGAHSAHTGSGANFVCLHSSPQPPDGWSTHESWGAVLYGAQYRESVDGDSRKFLDAACIICVVDSEQAATGSTISVQYGRGQFCSETHKTLYSGFVMASHNSQQKNEFVCVDSARDHHAGSSSADESANHLYLTEVQGTYVAFITTKARDFSSFASSFASLSSFFLCSMLGGGRGGGGQLD